MRSRNHASHQAPCREPGCNHPDRPAPIAWVTQTADGRSVVLRLAPALLIMRFVIRANCRERFTAADFDFVVRTLARSSTEHVSLVDLLSDCETRDAVLDSPRLIDAILSNAGHLRISSQFYFYVLARHVLQAAGINDRKLCDYVGSLLEAFLFPPECSKTRAPRTWYRGSVAVAWR